MKRWLTTLSLAAAVALTGARPGHADAEIGKPAPAFSLTDTNGKTVSLADHKGKTVVLEWINYGCPFVKKHYETGNMQALQKEAAAQGVVWLSICSSAKGKEGHMSPADWNKANKAQGFAGTAVLLDAEGTVGKAYGAKTTPHMFVVDAKGNVAYMGAIDDKSSFDKEDVKTAKNHVRAALADLKAGKKVATSSTKPYGCSVKYK